MSRGLSKRMHGMIWSLAIGSASLAAGQALPAAAPRKPPVKASKTWIPPRTAYGQPDLEGIWTNSTITPFERPDELAGRKVFTEQEAARFEREVTSGRAAPPKDGDVGSYNEAWFESGTKVLPTLQSSLVVDPPDGKVPIRPEAEAKRDFRLAREEDSYEYMTPWDRCITRGVPGSMFPAAYNNGYQILQNRDYVVIFYEMIHDARVIPLNKPHIPSNIRQWDGDAQGHWDGNTLVVDTANFSGKSAIASQSAAGRIKGVPDTESMHVVERFTRSGLNTIDYQVTIEDPSMYARPWTMAFPLTRDPEYQIFEYACHEGNSGVESVLRAGRIHDSDSKGNGKTK